MKLFSLALTCLISVVSFAFSAEEWRSLVGDNVVNDIGLTEDKIFVATNGGIEVFWKDTTKRFDNGLPWQIYRRNADGSAIGGLPRNNIRSIVATNYEVYGEHGSPLPRGSWWAMGDNWIAENIAKPEGGANFFVSRTPSNFRACDLAIQKSQNVCPGPYTCFKVYAANDDGLSTVDDHAVRSMISLPHGVNRIAVDDSGSVWGIFTDGLVFQLKERGVDWVGTTWRCDKELTKGAPNNIAVKGDTVVVTAESGFYLKIGSADWQQFSWPMINVGPYTLSHLPIPVAISKGCVIFGAGGEVYAWDPSQPNAFIGIVPGGVHSGFSMINCLAADEKNLYLGTDNKMWVCEGGRLIGQTFTQKSVTGIRYPHNNVITHINADNAGRILVGSASGGYRYDVDANSPALNSSTQNVSGEVLTSFVDKDGAQWIGRDGYIERNGVKVNLPTMPNGLNNPYWLVGDLAKNCWLVYSVSNGIGAKVCSYTGEGTWGIPNPSGIPTGLANQRILSVSSTGKHLFIATDSAAYIFDFFGNWVRQALGYSTNQKICGDEGLGTHAWVANGDSIFTIDGSGGMTFHGACPWYHRIINDIVLDGDNKLWVATDSGAYCYTRAGSTINVPMDKLADKFVNTIFVQQTATEKQVWFGTAGGLTVWHQPNLSATGLSVPVRSSFQLPIQNQRSFDLLGRNQGVPRQVNRAPMQVRLIQNGNKNAAKSLNIAR